MQLVLFILMLFSLAMQKLFIFMRSYLFILSFMSLALGDISGNILLLGICQIFLPMFSSRTFMVSWLMFKSFIHFEFILVYGVNWWSSFIFLHVPVLPTPFIEEAIFQIVIDHRDLGLFLGSLFCSIDLCVCYYASARLF